MTVRGIIFGAGHRVATARSVIYEVRRLSCVKVAGRGTGTRASLRAGRTESRLHTTRHDRTLRVGAARPPAPARGVAPGGAASAEGERLPDARYRGRAGAHHEVARPAAAARTPRRRARAGHADVCADGSAPSPRRATSVSRRHRSRATHISSAPPHASSRHTARQTYTVYRFLRFRVRPCLDRARTRRVGHLKGQRAAMCVPFN